MAKRSQDTPTPARKPRRIEDTPAPATTPGAKENFLERRWVMRIAAVMVAIMNIIPATLAAMSAADCVLAKRKIMYQTTTPESVPEIAPARAPTSIAEKRTR